MDLFGLADAIKRRKKMLDEIDQPVSKPGPITPGSPPASPPLDQGTVEEIQARKKRINKGW